MSGAAAVYVGLDCGGSTSRALALDATGLPLYRGQSGAANLASTPEPILRRHLQRATEACPAADAVYGCFAGLLTEGDRLRAESLLKQLFPGAVVGAAPDFAAALMAAETPIDVCVIAGTGALVCSKTPTGWVKTGGGGYLLCDDGSAFDLGRRVLKDFLFGDEPPTEATTALVAETFETLDRGEIVSKLYANPSPPALLAKLAPALVTDAATGREPSRLALAEAIGTLASQTVRHIHKHVAGTGTVRIGLVGGVWKNSANVLDVFASSIRDQLDRSFDVERLRRPPVYGAVTLARELMLGN